MKQSDQPGLSNYAIAQIIANDLQSLALRIEAMPSHDTFDRAISAVQMAREQVQLGQAIAYREREKKSSTRR